MVDPARRPGLFAYLREPVPAGQPQEFRHVARLLQATAGLGLAMLLPVVAALIVMPLIVASRLGQPSGFETVFVVVPLVVLCGLLGMALLGSWVLSSVYAKWVRLEPRARNQVGQVAGLLMFFGGVGLVETVSFATQAPRSGWQMLAGIVFDAAMLVLGIAFTVLLRQPGAKQPFAALTAVPPPA